MNADQVFQEALKFASPEKKIWVSESKAAVLLAAGAQVLADHNQGSGAPYVHLRFRGKDFVSAAEPGRQPLWRFGGRDSNLTH